MSNTLFEHVWDEHVVAQQPGHPAVLYIDLQLVHEVTSPQAFAELRVRGLKVRSPARTVATMDHAVPTLAGHPPVDADAAAQLEQLRVNCRTFGVTLHEPGSPHHGIVHVMGPDLGLTQPGMTIVCGDSHTSTHGAFGALAFGIGTSEVGHVLATNCLLFHRPEPMEVRINGRLQPGVSAKDVILALIARYGVDVGTDRVFEFTGSTVRALEMEARMTLCNMGIEAGARASMIAPDETTFAYLHGRPCAPQGQAWEAALERWRKLSTWPEARFSHQVDLAVEDLAPMVTFGLNPSMAIPIDGRVPSPDATRDATARQELLEALDYMDLAPGQALLGHPIDVVFLGSCTNSRLSDLRQAADVLRGRRVDPRVRMLVVPGSQQVKREAEQEDLHRVFLEAGAEWREPGCSMCIAINGDQLEPGAYAVSTSNRNFAGRQGPGGRTFLASPWTAAASAVKGCLSDARELLEVA